MAPSRLVVVGSSLAGLRAAEAARRTGFTGTVTMIGAEDHLPYDKPPLSKAFLDSDDRPTPAYRDRESLAELGIDLVLGEPATGLDTEARSVQVGAREIPYDALVIATGARARSLPALDGYAGVHTLRSLDDAVAVRSAVADGAHAVVIGAGFIGSEVASSARSRGLPATVVEASETPLARAIGEEMGAVCARLHPANGTALRTGVTAVGAEGDGRVERVLLSDGSTVDADLVVVGVGAVPDTDWLAGSGVTTDDGVLADATLATGVPGVYAAGDAVRWHNELFDETMRLENWTSAAEQGALAARNALDPAAATPYSTVPYFWSDWYGVRIQFAGVARADEVVVVDGDVDRHRFVALYRRGDRLVGALTLARPTEIMKYRALIARRAGWAEAREFAAARAEAAAARC